MTYQEFKDHIATFLWRAGDQPVLNALDNLITLAEARLTRDLKIEDAVQLYAAQPVDNVMVVPAGYRSLDQLIWDQNFSLYYVTPYEFHQRKAPSGTMAEWFTIVGNQIWLAGTIADPTFIISYFATVPDYQTDDASWVADRHLDLLTYCTLMHCGHFIRDETQAADWKAEYVKELANVMEESTRLRYPKGGPLIEGRGIRGTGATPSLLDVATPDPPEPTPPPPVISGGLYINDVLTTTNGEWLNDPISFAYQWLRDGIPIPGATSNTYTLTLADAERAIRSEVTATDATGREDSAQSNILIPLPAEAPVNSVLPVASGTAEVGQTVSVDDGTWIGGNPLPPYAITYQWQRDTVDIPGATDSTYVITVADEGATIRAAVTATSVSGSTTVFSNDVGTVLDIPENTVPPVVSGSLNINDVLSTTDGTWLHSPTSFTYQWMRNGSPIAGATANTYTLTLADASQTIRADVTACNVSGCDTAPSNDVFPNAAAPPVNTVLPVITPTGTQLGDTLTTDDGTWIGGNPLPPYTITYQWQRDGIDLAGETSNSYTIGSADYGATLRVIVTATSVAGSTDAISLGVVADPATPPVNTIAPAVTGTPNVGQTLTTDDGTWTGYPPPPYTYTYQWQNNTVDIPGATSNTYVIQEGDLGDDLRVVVTASSPGGSTPANSNTVVVSGDDPYFGDVELLILNNDPDLTATPTDSSSKARVPTLVDGGNVTTSEFKFPTGSWTPPGVHDEGEVTYDNTDQSLGLSKNASWTVEAWVNPRSTVQGHVVGCARAGIGNFWWVLRASTGGLTFVSTIAGNSPFDILTTTGGSLSIGTWHHIAASFDAGTTTLRLFIDGVEYAENTSWTTPNSKTNKPCDLFNSPGASNDHLDMYVDSLRVTDGVSRYNANFTPPDKQFPTS